MAVYDAQSNNTARGTRQYTDLDLFLERNLPIMTFKL